MSAPHPILVFVIYFLAFFLPGLLTVQLVPKGLRRVPMLVLSGLSLLGATLVFAWDFAIKPALS